MAVLKSQRNLSSMEFYHVALDLRKYLTMFLLRDFGLKDNIHDKTYFVPVAKLDQLERKQLSELLHKCDHATVVTSMPYWIIRQEQEFFSNKCRDLISAVSSANNIYMQTLADADQRRCFQNEAICVVENIVQELQYLVTVFDAKCTKSLEMYIEMAQRELSLLKGWRKSDNKRRHAIEEKLKATPADCHDNS